MEHKTGIVFNIQHFSIQDGPGIRTTVFLKGCPLRCRWCANPESQRHGIEMGWTKGECLYCESCIAGLPTFNCRFDEAGDLYWDRKAKITDQKAVGSVCPSQAFHVIGEERTAEHVLEEVIKDKPFFNYSGGGLTVSGGEPLSQPDFTRELLHLAGEQGIHRAIESTLYAEESTVLDICRELDLLIMDIKSMDEERHKEWTGVSNARILQNLRAVRRELPDLPILVRTPVIPGFNDDSDSIGAILGFLNELQEQGEASVSYEPLKYHRLGEPKYRSLNRNYEMGEAELDEERFAQIKQQVQKGFCKRGKQK
ncbi:MAG: glycyl-radical enzyme activating protein, partial [Eubacteriales bacterium]|nr:glycyl-radical enzyme activating protein [Eubacteriales bacterium]